MDYRFELSKKVLCNPVGQRATNLKFLPNKRSLFIKYTSNSATFYYFYSVQTVLKDTLSCLACGRFGTSKNVKYIVVDPGTSKLPVLKGSVHARN